jgi:hypothetical protein
MAFTPVLPGHTAVKGTIMLRDRNLCQNFVRSCAQLFTKGQRRCFSRGEPAKSCAKRARFARAFPASIRRWNSLLPHEFLFGNSEASKCRQR